MCYIYICTANSLLIHIYFSDDYEYTATESDGERITDCDTDKLVSDTILCDNN